MSFGHLYGGWLADRVDPRRFLGGVLLVASGLVAALLCFQPLIRWASETVMAMGLSPLVGIFNVNDTVWRTLLLYGGDLTAGLQAVTTGCRTGLRHGWRPIGQRHCRFHVGNLRDWFWMIPSFSTQAIMVGVAVSLGLLGVLASPWSRTRGTIATACIMLIPWLAIRVAPALATNICQVESAYFCIRVINTLDGEGERIIKQLGMDSFVHSGIRPDQPVKLWYEYEQVTAWVVEASGKGKGRSLFLGVVDTFYPIGWSAVTRTRWWRL